MSNKKDNGLARVLSDLPQHGARAGDLLQASQADIKALAKAGHVDPAPDAVDYAKGSGAKVVDITAADLAAE